MQLILPLGAITIYGGKTGQEGHLGRGKEEEEWKGLGGQDSCIVS